MLLSRALEHTPQAPKLLNTLGVAWLYDERRERATDAFLQAVSRDPAYAAPLFNLSVLAREAHRQAEALRYEQAYARLLAGSAPASPTARQPVETVAGVRPGTPVQDVPVSWGVPAHSTVQLAGSTFTVATYPAGIMALAQHGNVLMLMVREGYRGTSARGITLGSQTHDVLTRYGPPTWRHELSSGHSWAYDAPRIVFQFHNGQVVSWLRF
jgi:hypothetical protein